MTQLSSSARWLKTSFLLAADFEKAQNDAEPQYLVSPQQFSILTADAPEK
jgi:hypothetical protein